MTIIATILRVLISAIVTLLTIIAPWAPSLSPYKPLDKDACLLNFAAISDTHYESDEHDPEDAVYSDITHNVYMPNLKQGSDKLDALVIAGDITDHGYASQWDRAEDILTSYDVADEMILAMGNHDLWTRDEQGRTSKGLFLQYNKRITGKYVSDAYYSTEVNGYPFIVLCSEADETDGYFTDKQIKWLKKELKKAAKKDLPIFVICHWPLNQTHGLPVTFGDDEYTEMTGGMGENSARIERLLKKYDNVFLISGHIHIGFSNAEDEAKTGYRSIESDGSFHSINLPRINAMTKIGYPMMGTGYNVEVYEDKVVFRARNYAMNTWVPKYDCTIELV